MRRVKFPHCVKCGSELNPNKYDDCEKYYLTDDGIINYYRADDTGSAIKGNKLDLCVSSHQEAINLGVRTATVYWVEAG